MIDLLLALGTCVALGVVTWTAIALERHLL